MSTDAPASPVKERTAKILRKLRKIHAKICPSNHRASLPPFDLEGQAASDRIREMLGRKEPCMIGRMGGTETEVIVRYIDLTANVSFWQKSSDYIRGQRDCFWFSRGVIERIFNLSGVFPPTEETIMKFSVKMLDELRYLDLLGSWVAQEKRLQSYYSPKLIRIPLEDLEPYLMPNPWSEILAGKKVLVIHPFEESIQRQYARRHLLFKDPRVLPEFELKTLKSVQSLGCIPPTFPDWFAALDSMCQQISKIDFDIAIIGAGAYGLPMAAHVKRLGKKAIHLGGATQLLFGIRGRRWDDYPTLQHLFNEHWVRPLPSETPPTANSVEAGCYW